MWICKYCNESFEFNSTSEKANHTRWCDKNPKDYHNLASIKAMNEKKKELGVYNQFDKAKKNGSIINSKLKGKKIPEEFRYKHSLETKMHLSIKRKEYLKNNPDKHPWRKNKNVSVPCELLKNKLREANIIFDEEFMPLFPERYFSIDIAFLDLKIGIEVNGNQHYNKDGTLQNYYQNRHELIEKTGWKIIEIHYLTVYKMIQTIEKLESKENLINIARHYSIKPSEFLSTFTRIEKEEHDREKSLF